MKKPKAIFIGRSGSGKTTLTQVLRNLPITYEKTQALTYNGIGIDTPGEYIESRHYYSALITASYDCDIIFLVQSAQDTANSFPPGFASVFPKEVYGIVTKIDDCLEKERAFAGELLTLAGACRIYYTSSLEKTGLDPVLQLISRKS